jgi:uncharacterized membrane protein
VHYDPDHFGTFSESIARFIGTARFLVYQSVFCVCWIVWNLAAPESLQFDPNSRGLVLLTLLLSLQAAYAAPLILLAQNRQAERDRIAGERDRANLSRTLDETAFLGRELATIRLALSDVVTSDDVDDIAQRVAIALEQSRVNAESTKDASVLQSERRSLIRGRRRADRDATSAGSTDE